MRPNTYITILVSTKLYSRVLAEVSRCFGPEEGALRKNIRVAAVIERESGSGTDQGQSFPETCATVYRALQECTSITCATTGQQLDPVCSPSAIILDYLLWKVFEAIRMVRTPGVRILSFFSCGASSVFHHHGPPNLGGKPDLRPQIYEETHRTGEFLEDVANKMMLSTDGSLVQVPGLPPMYDYEYNPQTVGYSLGGIQTLHAYTMFEQCDGMILSTSENFEPQAVAGIRDWFSSMSRKTYTIGPLLPDPQENTSNGEMAQASDATEVESFLEKVHKSHGENSLIYISFGTVFFTHQVEKIWAFVGVVMQKKIPFIMSYAAPTAYIPDIVSQMIKKYGLGLVTRWSPQQTILAHPVTGWFLTHAGQNSSIEAISAGVPMICWPIFSDQPTNAAHLSVNLDIAYELLEVRTGDGLRPLYRTGKSPKGTIQSVREEAMTVLNLALGEDGRKKRENVKALREKVLSSWAEDGSSREDMKKLMNDVLNG